MQPLASSTSNYHRFGVATIRLGQLRGSVIVRRVQSDTEYLFGLVKGNGGRHPFRR